LPAYLLTFAHQLFPFDLSSVQKICQMSVPHFSILEDFPNIFKLENASKIFVSFSKKSPSEVFSVEYFLEIFQSRHLPTLKIGII